MILEKGKDNIYTISDGRQISKTMSYYDFVMLLCDDDTEIFENNGVYITKSWKPVLKPLGIKNVEMLMSLVNKKNDADLYLRISRKGTTVVVTSTDYFGHNSHQFIWMPFEHKHRHISNVGEYILVPKNQEFSAFSYIIKVDEDHEKDADIFSIKVKDTEYFENAVIPKLREVFGEAEIKE